MINLYVFDYYDLFKLNGLATYLNQLIDNLPRSEITLHHVWVKSGQKYKEPHTDITNNAVNIFIPHEINIIGGSNNALQDSVAADFISSDAKGKKNVLFHFNWINHCGFSFLLTRKVKGSKTLLTKHCIPWRDLIVDDYLVFRRINQHVLSSQDDSFYHPVLNREQIAYLSIDHVIGVTHFAKKVLTKIFKISDSKISVIYNGLNSDNKITDNKNKLRQKYGFSQDEKVVLYAGAVQQRKGIWDLIKAFDKIAAKKVGLRLIIAGGGQHSKIFETTQKHWSKITVTGNLDKKTLMDFYQIADIGVIPSYVEQCSYTAIEMMHYKLPIIVANIDGLAEIVRDDCGLKVPLILGKSSAAVDPKKLAESILYFLEHDQIAKEYAKRAKLYAFKNLNVKNMVERTMAVYKNLISEKTKKINSSWRLDSKLVSIILPCYNASKHIKECIDSILCQTYQNFELIIIDDKSTDNTRKIIEEYKDIRLKIFKNEKNEGIVATVNKLIKLAIGQYIARIDADDMMHETRIEKQVAFLEDKNRQDISLVGSNHFVIDSFSRLVGIKQYPSYNEKIKMCLLFQNPISNPSVMARASALKKIRLTQKYPYAEDYHGWFTFANLGNFANISECLTYYRVHENNLSTVYHKTQKESVAQLVTDQLDKFNIQYSIDELAIHLAAYFGHGNRYFNDSVKINALQQWVAKVLDAQGKRLNLKASYISKAKKYVLEDICGVYELNTTVNKM